MKHVLQYVNGHAANVSYHLFSAISYIELSPPHLSYIELSPPDLPLVNRSGVKYFLTVKSLVRSVSIYQC